MEYVKINLKNYFQYYYNLNGNLYYEGEDKKYYVVDDFLEEDVKNALRNKVKIIFIKGKALNSFDKKDLKKEIKEDV